MNFTYSAIKIHCAAGGKYPAAEVLVGIDDRDLDELPKHLAFPTIAITVPLTADHTAEPFQAAAARVEIFARQLVNESVLREWLAGQG